MVLFHGAEQLIEISGGSRISCRGGVHLLGGHGPPMWALFGENVCENERIGSHGRGHAPGMPPLDLPMEIVCPV